MKLKIFLDKIIFLPRQKLRPETRVFLLSLDSFFCRLWLFLRGQDSWPGTQCSSSQIAEETFTWVVTVSPEHVITTSTRRVGRIRQFPYLNTGSKNVETEKKRTSKLAVSPAGKKHECKWILCWVMTWHVFFFFFVWLLNRFSVKYSGLKMRHLKWGSDRKTWMFPHNICPLTRT